MSTVRMNLQQFRDGSRPDEEAQVWLEASELVANQGDLGEARNLAHAAVQAEPNNATAWVQLARLTPNPQKKHYYLNQALALEPAHTGARTELLELERQSPLPPTAGEVKRRGIWAWLLTALAVVAGLLLVAVVVLGAILAWGPQNVSLPALLVTPTPTAIPTPTMTPGELAAQFVPQLREAMAHSNWDRAVEIADIIQAVDPEGAGTREWALATHMQYGQALVEGRQVDLAQAQFDLAAELAPENALVSAWRGTTQLYLAGDQALKARQWEAAIRSFSLAQEQMPDYGDLTARLVETYRGQGQAAIGNGDWPQAVEALNQAYQRAPDDQAVAALLSRAYRGQGQAAIDDGLLAEAIETLEEGRDTLPQDADLAILLASVYRQRGIQREEAGQLQGARSDLEAALALRPGDAEAKAHLDRVMYRLFPPKRIEINISTQRFYAYEGDTLVYSFPTSTGLRGRDTAAGHYRVLDKIPMAYSSIWRLQMPYWLGIYWVGNVENGIHALPIRPDGSVMWGGLLGQRASYGCVILSTQAARLIYNWADIGTPVHIHY